MSTITVFQRSPVLPFELIEHALGYLCDPEYIDHESRRTLYNCMLTCRALVPRSRYLLFLHLDVASHHAYTCLSDSIQHLTPVINCTRELRINDLETKSCAQLLVHQFAHQLSRLERLHIREANWKNSSLNESFFLSLGLLTSVTSPKLFWCEFASLHDFHRMLCALPALTKLELDIVTWENELSPEPDISSQRCRPLQLESLSVKGPDLEQMLGWFVCTTACTSLCALDVTLRHGDALLVLKPVLEGLGPSLESLALTFWGCDFEDIEFGLENNTRLKSFTFRYVNIADVPGLLAHVSSTELSRLTLILSIEVDTRIFDHSGWDEFLAILTRPAFKRIEHVEIMAKLDNWDTQEDRRRVRQLFKMLHQWLAPIKVRAILCVQTLGDVFEEEDGPVEGDVWV